MSDEQKQIDDGGPAFPHTETWEGVAGTVTQDYLGMTLRDYFAAKAMQGMLAYSPTEPANGDYHTNATSESVAYAAYAQADAMLAERKGGAV